MICRALQPGQPPPNIDVQLEIDWSPANNLSSVPKLPSMFGQTLEWKAAEGESSARRSWSEGCYVQVSIPLEALRSRPPGKSDPSIVNPWWGWLGG